ncbi:MAG: DUF21 domain-containing protein [Chloroflexi bacterium]|uniref:CNNM domain-containing protein n=1 Tax=Candidatus Flexifilum breve TaxID=3140694 RepID=UPI0031365A4F|nr:DUF21 domain-containing protein [Chloroflexota bacterium]
MLGDLVPSALGNAYADQLAPLVATPLRLFTLLLSPLVKLFMSLSDTISRITGGEEMDKAVTEEEIMTLVEDGQKGGAIEDEEREMIYSVLQFGETLAREVMVLPPRPDRGGMRHPVERGRQSADGNRTFPHSGVRRRHR